MTRWLRSYTAVAHERYPGLAAFASLLVGEDDARVTQLVDDALVSVFGRLRRPLPADQAEGDVRMAITRGFLATSRADPHHDSADTAPAARATSDTAMDLSIYAPPDPTTEPDPHAEPERQASTTTAKPSVPTRATLASALLDLPPQVRAIVVLRSYEDLSVAHIAQELRLPVATVTRDLAMAAAHLDTAVGLSIAPDAPRSAAIDSATVSVGGHVAGR
ncbi:sigma factor-like helix-turn-helix DNA-binding protein [Demequina sp.]|uniref:sigma factor-like helix-turn-helix DNA-binding protein n=1 Tax=Demequina sp. TaxID=2050685 RepID=UPI003A8BAC97